MSAEAGDVRAIRLRFDRDPWYTRMTYADGATYHLGPWATRWAAEAAIPIILARERYRVRSGAGGTARDQSPFPPRPRRKPTRPANRRAGPSDTLRV